MAISHGTSPPTDPLRRRMLLEIRSSILLVLYPSRTAQYTTFLSHSGWMTHAAPVLIASDALRLEVAHGVTEVRSKVLSTLVARAAMQKLAFAVMYGHFLWINVQIRATARQTVLAAVR